MARLAILTSGGDYSERILVGLSMIGVIPDTVLIVRSASARPDERMNAVKKMLSRRQPGEVLTAAAHLLARGLRRRTNTSDQNLERFSGFARRTIHAGPLNGERMLDLLRADAPDYLLMAGSGILAEEALTIPSRGVINVHPGLLPWVRGVGVVEGGLLRRLPVGITAHFVDAGIDTGDIIHRELVPVQEVDTVGSLRRKAYELCARTMVELASAAVHGHVPVGFRQEERYPYCRWPALAERNRVASEVRKGLARKLYLQWRSITGSDVLPRIINDRPPILIQGIPNGQLPQTSTE